MNMSDILDCIFEYEGQTDDQRRQSLLEQLNLLVVTRKGSILLDRGLGMEFGYIDRPIGVARSLFAVEITEAIAKYIPSISVRDITWTGDADGHFRPKVVVADA